MITSDDGKSSYRLIYRPWFLLNLAEILVGYDINGHDINIIVVEDKNIVFTMFFYYRLK